jgi:hypothetical protein
MGDIYIKSADALFRSVDSANEPTLRADPSLEKALIPPTPGHPGIARPQRHAIPPPPDSKKAKSQDPNSSREDESALNPVSGSRVLDLLVALFARSKVMGYREVSKESS